MKQVSTILFPYQSTYRKLGLSARWWHRLAIVVFFVGCFVASVASWFAAYISFNPIDFTPPYIRHLLTKSDGDTTEVTLGPLTQSEHDAMKKASKTGDAPPVGTQMYYGIPADVSIDWSRPLKETVEMPDGITREFVGKSDTEITAIFNQVLHRTVAKQWVMSFVIAFAALISFSYLIQGLYRLLIYVIYGSTSTPA